MSALSTITKTNGSPSLELSLKSLSHDLKAGIKNDRRISNVATPTGQIFADSEKLDLLQNGNKMELNKTARTLSKCKEYRRAYQRKRRKNNVVEFRTEET
ncbi:hypothetical protein AVEN_100443-1 [Araneus ventricosus]|uniref:Uncharacterized protein n=1 Tax=Araneus ventricosus TaxID=182803 RepID=A0A4Y2D1V1_ARAVE|nr:hypothetical protein AVEN_100443-1 [Araneus ventricosus]